ncbi:uncharacterized protein LOC121868951 [Homarus americanus]|uniref:uncharacterized protein LOC121868951 n=1 Tax=Homarus americanus TaxID=6706 RepID=UPI001C474145|nr:uncharacterized protein LOC121868951 [Homarus americanus]
MNNGNVLQHFRVHEDQAGKKVQRNRPVLTEVTTMTAYLSLVLVMAGILQNTVISILLPTDGHNALKKMEHAIGDVLNASYQADRTIIYIADDTFMSNSILQNSSVLFGPWSIGVVKVSVTDFHTNKTEAFLSLLLAKARRLRQMARNVTVVTISEDPNFLAAFGEMSLKQRLFVWATRLLIVTQLPLPDLRRLLSSHWTFTMMNTLFMNFEEVNGLTRGGLYAHLPYSLQGAQVLRIATWTQEQGVTFITNLPLFSEKFSNFYGMKVNVTALPFPPYWNVVEETDDAGTIIPRYSGTDYLMLETTAQTLNFTTNVLPTSNWEEVTKRVEERTSFIATVIYAVFPQRLQYYDYSFMFEYAFHAFSMAKPALKPGWQSLYYPLTNEVWASILAVLLVVPLPLLLIDLLKNKAQNTDHLQTGSIILEVFGMLLGQELSKKLSSDMSSRLLVSAWIVFAFIVGTAYRGNLTASLTAPKYPARVETLEQLVSSGASYRREMKKVLRREKSGAGTDNFCQPSLWFYNDLHFLRYQEIQEEGVSIMDSNEDGNEKSMDKFLGCSHPSRTDDAIDVLAKTWAAEFRKLREQQQIYARKALNGFLFEGRLGIIHRHSVKISEPNII